MTLLEKLRDIHTDQKLCGEPRNVLLNTHDDLLLYLLSLLRGDAHLLPQVSPEISIDEWKKLLSALRSHWITPLLYYKIGNSPPEFHPPGEILDQMRTAFLLSRIQCLKIEKQVNEIVNSFNRKGIEFIVLKGPALAHSIYPDPATRPHCDLDILVREEDFINAKGLLEEIGYKSKTSRFGHLKGVDCEEAFTHQRDPDKNIMVELHWDLHILSGHKGKQNIKELFHRSIQLETPSLSFKVLDPVDTLIACVLHMTVTHSADIRLLSIYDIALLLQKITDKHEWQILIERSIEFNARIGLEESIKIAQLWTGLNLHADFIDFHKWPTASDIEYRIVPKVKNILGTVLNLNMSVSSNPLQKVRYTFRLAFPGTDHIRKAYPPSRNWLLPLSYIKRWLKWIK
ncbi:MAG: nucleotidyltransferase family protein [Nitrospirae bacterium]|nr:nucleotidyltransferase family protein [Nitrospirota bacterium]